MDLRPEEVRVVGCLVEKQLSTPAYYPLTLNALVHACNQSSNRDPVVSYDERTVETALSSLRERGLVRIVYSTSNRAAKYRHVLDEALGLEPAELAVLAELLLRGPQTGGELRSRTDRMHAIGSVGEVEEVLDGLAQRPTPLVLRLPRQPGRREARTAHLLAGDVEPDLAPVPSAPPDGAPGAAEHVDPDRLAALEAAVAQLREELEDLRARLGDPVD